MCPDPWSGISGETDAIGALAEFPQKKACNYFNLPKKLQKLE
jgi:hypothetical protein